MNCRLRIVVSPSLRGSRNPSPAFPKLCDQALCPRRIARVLFIAQLVLCVAAPAVGQSGGTISVANGDVAGLITAIQTLNANGGGTIELASGGLYSVTAASDWWYGPNAFPAISAAIVINGNGATIQSKYGGDDGPFRFFYVSGGFSTLPAGNLTLQNLTLTGGLAQGGTGGSGTEAGGGGAGMGGAIFYQGTLTLLGLTISSNSAVGAPGAPFAYDGYGFGGGGGLGGNGSTSGGGGG